jgi:hypothetical protein
MTENGGFPVRLHTYNPRLVKPEWKRSKFELFLPGHFADEYPVCLPEYLRPTITTVYHQALPASYLFHIPARRSSGNHTDWYRDAGKCNPHERRVQFEIKSTLGLEALPQPAC